MENLQNNQIIAFLLFIGLCIALTLPVIVLKYKEVNCDNMTVEEFANSHPFGTYLIRVPSHLTVIINGVLYDIWDCRHEFCDTVWKRVD